MPFIRPDVVKLDRSVVQSEPSADSALVIDAVRSYAASSGAQVLAEGIETMHQRWRAGALGATLGQGWLFGFPEELGHSGASRMHNRTSLIIPRQSIGDETPCDVIRGQVTMEPAAKRELAAMSRALERRALDSTEPCVVLGTFQTASRFTGETAALYSRIGQRAAFVGAFAEGLGVEPAPGVRGGGFERDHRLRNEWDVVVVGPHSASALVAEDLGDVGPDGERRFAFAMVRDHELVLRAARSLMLRLAAVGGYLPDLAI
jgi:hypothetical protein